ncbi:MAG TPA: tetratricopeptide repeat protein [Opitutaceae bacterium]
MIRSLLSLTLIAITACTLAAQAPRGVGQDFWSNPAMVEKFVGSYGMISSVEPKLSTSETEAFKKFAEAMKTDANAATAILRSEVKADGSHGAQVDFVMGNLSFQAGRADEAMKYYREAIRKFADFRRAHNNLGILLAQRGQFKEAITHLAKTIETGGGDAVTYGLMAYGYLQQNLYLSAEIAYRNALIFEPNNTDWILGLAKSLLESRKFDEAVLLLDDMLKTQETNADLWLFQANAFLGKGDVNRAAANLEIVRRLGKIQPDMLARLGDLFADAGAHDLALTAYQEALAKDPRLPIPGLMQSAELLVARGGNQQGAQLVSQIRSTLGRSLSDSDKVSLQKIEARIAASRGEVGDAAKTLELIVESNPLDAEALLLLANVYARRGEVEKADFLFSRASRIRGSEAVALVQHGRFLVRAGKYSAALTVLERAQSMRPDEHVSRFIEQVRAAARSASF